MAKEDTLDTFVAPRYRKQRAKPSSKETKAAAAEAAQFAAEMLIPQSAFDAGLMLIPGGKIARKAGAALIALDAGDVEAGGLSALRKFRDLINREAPEQANKIREALRLTKQTGREHSVIGLADEGGESVITRGTESAVLPNSFDLRTAKRAPGSPTIVDFHTHPGQGTIFETAPSRQDFQFYSSEYPSKAGRDLRTLVAVPPTRDGARQTTSYNFFETRDPAKVFDPNTLDSARYELQRAGKKGSFKSIQDDPVLREYFDYGGDLASLLEDATPLALMRYRAGQGLGRHELQLGGTKLAPTPGATDIELFRQLERPAVELLKSKKFAAGGSVSVYDPDKIDEIMNSFDKPTGYAEGGTVKTPDLDFVEDPETLRLYKHAMKQFMPNQEDTISTVSTGVQGRVGGGNLSAGIDMNRMTKGQQDQLMKSIAANYNVDLGDVNLNTRLEAPLDAKDIYVGMINGSIPIGEGRAMLGLQGIKTPYGSDVLGYNAGYSGKVGSGRLNVNVNKPKRGKPSAQVQYQIPFAEGGPVYMGKGGALAKFVKKITAGSDVLPAAERDANLAKFLEGNKAPPTVYHSTSKDFNQFSPKKLGQNTKHPTTKLGFFTAADPASTEDFISSTSGVSKGLYESGANIMPLHVSIKNPYEIPSTKYLLQSMALQNMKKKDADKFIQEFIDSVKAEGHDGLLIKANPNSLAKGNEFTSDNWVAFEPTQIKSATGNRGTYDINEPDLNKAHGGSVRMAQGGSVTAYDPNQIDAIVNQYV